MNQKELKTFTSTRIKLYGTIVLVGILILSCLPISQTPAPQVTPVEAQYIGRILDAITQKPIGNAKVSLDFQGIPSIEYTDSEGIYQFKLSVNSEINGTIRVDAQGYDTYTRNIKISPAKTAIEDIRLTQTTMQPEETQAESPTQISESSASKWCDTFDDGILDASRWNNPEQPASIFEQNGVLSLQFTESQTDIEDPWAGLEAVQTNRLISEITFTMVLQEFLEGISSGAGVDIFMKDVDPIFSLDIGPQLEGLGGGFSFCPNYEAFVTNTGCRYPTPIPDSSAFTVDLETPIEIRVIGTGADIRLEANNTLLASESINAPIENFQFFIYSDPRGALKATIDNVCVTYLDN